MSSTLFTAMQAENNLTETTNGMTAYVSTLNAVLDLFSKGSSLRSASIEDIERHVMNALNEDKQLALRCLFYLRDIRGEGQGERRVFRIGLRYLAQNNIDSFIKSDIIKHIPTYGRWDDIFSLFGISSKIDEEIIRLLDSQLKSDIKSLLENPNQVSLLAKWMPSCNTSSKETRALAKKIYKSLRISEKQYRKMLSKLRKQIDIIETRLSNKDYTFDYSKIPSNANMKYRKCFERNDMERFVKHNQEVAEALKNPDMYDCCSLPKDNVATLYPYEIVEKIIDNRYMNEMERLRYDNMWKQLPNYFGENSKNKNWMTVVDTSGSMLGYGLSPSPMSVAISLGIYIAERNTGIFKDKYVTFSTHPCLIDIKNDCDIYGKVHQIFENSIISDTNIEAVFDLLLNTAVKNNIPKEEMPEGIFIISDMQFNSAIEDGRNPAVYDMIKEKYAKAGYTVPKIIFWNVAQSDEGNLPVTKHENGAILVGGCKPGLFEMILSGKNPEDFMKSVLNGERYSSLELL